MKCRLCPNQVNTKGDSNLCDDCLDEEDCCDCNYCTDSEEE